MIRTFKGKRPDTAIGEYIKWQKKHTEEEVTSSDMTSEYTLTIVTKTKTNETNSN